jgi:hypothetical protein
VDVLNRRKSVRVTCDTLEVQYATAVLAAPISSLEHFLSGLGHNSPFALRVASSQDHGHPQLDRLLDVGKLVTPVASTSTDVSNQFGGLATSSGGQNNGVFNVTFGLSQFAHVPLM